MHIGRGFGNISRRKTFPKIVLAVSRFRLVPFSKPCSGSSTPARNGTLLPQSYPNYKTVQRRFQEGCRSDVSRPALTDIANTRRGEGEIDELERFIDATFASAKGGGDGIGKTKRGKGVKIMAIVDRHRLPLAVSSHAAHHHCDGF